MAPEEIIAIVFVIVGALAVLWGLRVLVRGRVTLAFRSQQVGKADTTLPLRGGPARLYATALLVLGARILWSAAQSWSTYGDLSEVSAGGPVAVAVVLAVLGSIGWGAFARLTETDEASHKVTEAIEDAHRRAQEDD